MISHDLGDKAGNDRLNSNQHLILDDIRNNHNATKPRLVSILFLSKTTIDIGIATLKKKCAIECIGSNKAGYWKVNDISDESITQ